MFLNLTYRSIYDQLDEALTKKTLIVTNEATRRIGKTKAIIHLAIVKQLSIVVTDKMLHFFTKGYPEVKFIGHTDAEKMCHPPDTMLIEEGVREETVTILRDKGVTVSGFLFKTKSLARENLLNEQGFTKEPALLQITLKDMNSIPEVIHNGEPLEGRIDIDFNWKTGGFDTVGSTYINLRTLGNKGKKPSEKRIEYKRGKALNELPTKDDLVWDKERGVYILQKKK